MCGGEDVWEGDSDGDVVDVDLGSLNLSTLLMAVVSFSFILTWSSSWSSFGFGRTFLCAMDFDGTVLY